MRKLRVDSEFYNNKKRDVKVKVDSEFYNNKKRDVKVKCGLQWSRVSADLILSGMTKYSPLKPGQLTDRQ